MTLSLSSSDLARIRSDPRFSPAHAALLDLMIERGEVTLDSTSSHSTPKEVLA